MSSGALCCAFSERVSLLASSRPFAHVNLIVQLMFAALDRYFDRLFTLLAAGALRARDDYSKRQGER